MLSRLLNVFRPPPPEPDPDAELALGALLVRVAKSDAEYPPVESALIDRILTELYHHGPRQAAEIRATCERLHAAAPETDVFAAMVRQNLDLAARKDVLQAIWRIALADGTETDSELRMIDDIREALGLTRTESAEMRAAAKGHAGAH
jgi:uncharacterized tellurite resistance protein B-like protein